jgi:hypothetical protein
MATAYRIPDTPLANVKPGETAFKTAPINPGGANADAINKNCLARQSVGMVLTQPTLSRTAWLGHHTRHQLSGGAQGPDPEQMLLQSGTPVGEQLPPMESGTML